MSLLNPNPNRNSKLLMPVSLNNYNNYTIHENHDDDTPYLSNGINPIQIDTNNTNSYYCDSNSLQDKHNPSNNINTNANLVQTNNTATNIMSSSDLTKPISITNYKYDFSNRFANNNNNYSSLKRSQTMHSTQINHSNNSNNNNSHRNSFIYTNRLNIIKDDLDIDEAGENKDSQNITPPQSSSSPSASSSSASSSSAIYYTNQLHQMNNANKIAKTHDNESSLEASTNSFTHGTFSLRRNNYDYNTLSRISQGTASLRKPNNDRLIGDILRNQTNVPRPVPPSRTSSLQYKQNPFKLHKLNHTNDYSSSDYDRNSIYSSFSMRFGNTSCLSSLNIENSSNVNDGAAFLLDKSEIFKIESCYKSIGSNVNSCKCSADLYSTNLQSLIKLLDWKHQLSGVPVWVFNTGLNPKRPKGLSLVMAEKKTGFALWRLDNITYSNDFKWTKPGHMSFKVFSNNLNFLEGVNSQMSHLKNKRSLKKNKSRPMSISNTVSSNLSAAAAAYSFRSSISSNDMKFLDSTYNEYSDFNLLRSIKLNGDNKNSQPYIFAALKFDNEFECSKFFEFYRILFSNSQNEDLFNPHYKPTNKTSFIKCFLKKITKNSISSPCAFHHINSLTIVNEESNNNICNLQSISDSQSMKSETTITSHNNSSIITNSDSKK